ncbi:MAG TPA: HAMP domain-containing sensor histidine kinase [Ohtaekwangia sp.]
MVSFLKKVTHLGVTGSQPKLLIRAIILTNRVAVISGIATTAYLFYSLRNGWNYFDTTILTTTVLLFSLVILNHIGAHTLSRILLTAAIPFTSMLLLILPRVQNYAAFEYKQGPGVYSVLLATAVLPVLIFTNRERKLMYICQGINLLYFASVDILVRWFSSLHALPTAQEYISGNLALYLAYFLLIGSVVSLKKIVDDFEFQNDQLIAGLNQKNNELERVNRALYDLNQDIETQNEEIQAQSEELLQSQDSLVMANNEIERQKAELEEQNRLLETSLDEKSRDLLHTNQQLVIQNSELEQFSYTVSHNLRGPVASVLGLINIHKISSTEADKNEILQLIAQSAQSLETIIQDLNKIIEIRSDRYSIYEDVLIDRELMLITQSLNNFLETNDVAIEKNIDANNINSVKAYINSILYNLISNAIQYRSPDRKPVIKISTYHREKNIVLEVSDNGLGIDLSRFQGEIFKLYKRFHTHTQGKGLGLYLVRQQVEKLNGKIEVESQLDEGTLFRVVLPKKEG